MSIIENIATKLGYDPKGDNGTEVYSTNSVTIAANQLERSIERLMDGEYLWAKTPEGHAYLKTGYSDDLQQVLYKMTRLSTTHAGIIQKKAKMVSGRNVTWTNCYKGVKGQSLDIFMKNINRKRETIGKILKHAAYQYTMGGAAAFLVKYNDEHTKVVSIESLDLHSVRREVEDGTGIPTENFVVRRIFGIKNINKNNVSRVVAPFNKFDKENNEQLLYLMNPYSGNEYYGIPNYVAAYNFVAADHEFGQTVYSSSANGFMPKIMATFIGRNMSKTEKEQQSKNFKTSFFGSKAEPVITAWVKKADEAPEIKGLDINNLDRTISVMTALNDAKILTAHNVTSPVLFGVMVAGKLGGTGNEILTAYQIFRATETMTVREDLTDELEKIFSSVGCNIKLTVEEDVVDMSSLKGVDTNDVKQEKDD